MESFDLKLSFELQLEEAIKATLPFHQVPSSFSTLFVGLEKEQIASLSLNHDEEMERLEQVRLDRELAEVESMGIQEDINRQIHDQIFAQEMSRISIEEWTKTGDNFNCPYGEGNSTDAEAYSLYCKGLVKQVEMQTLAGIGVAICDARDELVFKIGKHLVSGAMSPEFAEVKAMIEGLNAAVTLGMKRVTILCDTANIYSYITGETTPGQENIVTLVGQIFLLAKKFTRCEAKLLEEIKNIHAFGFANESIVCQLAALSETGSTAKHTKLLTCLICLEDVVASKMFFIEGCRHSYCLSCIKQHAEVKLLQGTLAKCPHEGCTTELKIETCKKLFTPQLYHTLSQRLKEASIPAGEKFYCPDPKCSVLMTKTDILSARADNIGASKCVKCSGLFCIDCKVSWHGGMSCDEYRKLHPFPCSEDAKLNSLASQKMWRQCVKCENMVELADGCHHIYCRCGYEFCYLCGAEWKNKRGTCKCPLWDERNIIGE